MIRAFVADDHAVVRRGLKALFAESGDIVVAGEAKTAREALDAIGSARWDVIVLDLHFPDGDGLDLLTEMRRRLPDVPVLVLSIGAEEHFAVRALQAGAAGYLSKEAAPAELIDAVRKVVAKGRYVSPAVAEQLAGWVDSGRERPPHERLSPREFQIFRLLARGRSVSGIAEDLCLSVKTVSTYRSRLLEKTNFRSNAEITVYALRHGLIDEDRIGPSVGP